MDRDVGNLQGRETRRKLKTKGREKGEGRNRKNTKYFSAGTLKKDWNLRERERERAVSKK